MKIGNPSRNYVPVLAIFMCCLVWGTTFVVVKDVSTQIDPFLLAGLRNLLAGSVLLLYLLFFKKVRLLKIKKSMVYGALLGGLLSAIYILQTAGLVYTTSNHSAFISCSAMIMVPIILFFIGWQKFVFKQIVAIVIITIGLFLLTYKTGTTNFNYGDILTFIAAILCAFHLIFSGHYVRKVDFLSLIFYQFLFATIVSFIGLFIKQQVFHEPILFKESSYGSVLYLGLLGTLFCYFVTVWGQKHVSTIYTALIFTLEPIFASITSFIVLGEVFTTKEFAGACSIFFGIVYYSLSNRKKVQPI
jgi:drug/metabolite transporter (DMT)-like permease